MDESLLFIIIMAALGFGWCWGMTRWPLWSRRLAIALCLFYILIMEWSMLSFELGAIAWEVCIGIVTPSWAPPLHLLCLYLLCSFVVLALLLVAIVPPLRRRWFPQGCGHLLLRIMTLVTLQMALYKDCFFPVFGGPLLMGFSLSVGAVVVCLLLWQSAVFALGRHMEVSRRRKRP